MVRAVLDGDAEARATFLTRMKRVARMLTYLNQRLGSRLAAEELEDVAQEAIVSIWRKLGSFEGRSSLDSWTYRFCQLQLMAWLRRRDRLPRRLEDLDEVERNAALSRPDPDPWVNEWVYQCLDRMEPELAEVLQRKHLEGLTFPKIAEVLETSIHTVKARYYRALPRFRELLRLREERGR